MQNELVVLKKRLDFTKTVAETGTLGAGQTYQGQLDMMKEGVCTSPLKKEAGHDSAVADEGHAPREDGRPALDKTSTGERSRVGHAPPCKSYMDLKTFSNLNLEGLYDCEDKEDIAQFLGNLKKPKLAIAELLKVCPTIPGG